MPHTALLSRGKPLDLEALVGPSGWARLPAAMRRRFATGHAATVYRGRMELERSAIGALFAWLARPFGAPLPWHRLHDVATEVSVIPDGAAVVWQRRFAAAGGRPAREVRSTKQANPDGTLLERTAGGLGMVLDVFEQDRALVFRSRGYFLAIGTWRLPLPALLTPGRCRVEHSGEGADRFRFTLDMTHPVWGRTFFQTGVFIDPEETKP